MIQCYVCSKELSGKYKLTKIGKKYYAICTTHTDSWAEDNKVEAAAPAIERSK